jgi:hypothetical protein
MSSNLDSAATGRRTANPDTARIVLLAGPVKVPDRVGHHDYFGGCRLLAALAEQTTGVQATVVRDGWPDDESILDSAHALIVYCGGGRKSPILASAPRTERVQRLIDRGVGIVMIHQAVSSTPELASRMMSWLGGVHVAAESARGHWRTEHRQFPGHPATRGVDAWAAKDGWLNAIRFVADLHGVTPLVWSGPVHRGSSAGGVAEVVAWAYERADGGRSFCFTGLDAHAAWNAAGVRQLLVNASLWSAGLAIPAAGAPCAIDPRAVRAYLTPRGSRSAWVGKLLQRGLRRLYRAG